MARVTTRVTGLHMCVTVSVSKQQRKASPVNNLLSTYS